MTTVQPTAAQNELLKFINPTDAPDIAEALKKVFNMALFNNSEPLSSKEKDDLFYLDRIIRITKNI